jgi:hypothetical protein
MTATQRRNARSYNNLEQATHGLSGPRGPRYNNPRYNP